MKMWVRIILCVAIIQTSLAYSPWIYNGTTPNLENIIKGRCTEYQVLNPDNRDSEFQVKVDCNALWDNFTSAFKNQDQCKTNFTNAYEKTFALIENKKLYTDNTLFWSGTREVVHEFTSVNTQYQTLEDTFTGYFANNLQWCGCTNCPGGIDYESCNKSCNSVTNEFWGKASHNFAMKSKGIVSVLINGTQKGHNTAYWRGSYFGKEELPTLGKRAKQGIVKSLNVYVINDVDEEPKEKCGEESVIQLVEDAHKYGIEDVKCHDEPREVKSILCAKYPSAKECQPIKEKTIESWKDSTFALIAVSIVLFITVIVLLVLYNKRKRDALSYSQSIDA